jgi:hypothetical protein
MALAYDLGEVDIYDDGRLGDGAGLRDLREHLHREVTRRWVRAARNVKRAIVLHDALGIGDKAPMSVMPAADRAAMFGRWLDERLLVDIGDGQWVLPYIAETANWAQAQQQSRNGLGDAQAPGSLIDAGPEDEPRDPHGRWAKGGGEASGIFAGVHFKGTVKQVEALQKARKAGAGKEEIAKMIAAFAGGQKTGAPARQEPAIAAGAGSGGPYAHWTPEMHKQYAEFTRGGSAGPPGEGSKWLNEFSERVKRELSPHRKIGDAQALGSLVSQTSYIEPKSVKVCQAATCGALADIRGAVSRRASEAVRTGLLFPPHSKRAPRIAKAVDAAMGEGLHRSRMLAEHAVTQAYTQATLDALEARGVTHVGTHGEHCLRDAGPSDRWMADEVRHTPQEQHPRSGRYVTKAVHARETHRHIRTGRFTSQKVRAGKQAQAEAEEAQAESRRGPVVIETAGDDRVCDICDGIAANSPYTINQARSLIPAHPNCRCEWVRAEAPARPSLLGPIPEEAERVLELPQPAPATGRGIAAVAAGVLASLAAAAVARPGRPPAPPAPPHPDEVLSEEPPAPPPLPAKPAPPLPESPKLPVEEPAAEPPESEPPLPPIAPIEFALPAEPMPQALELGAVPLEPDVAELINRIAARRGVLPGSLTQFYPVGVPPEIGVARRELMWTLNQRGWSIAAIAGWMHVTEHAVAAGIDRHRQQPIF